MKLNFNPQEIESIVVNIFLLFETPPKTGWRIAPYCQIQVFEDTYILSFRSWKKGLDGYEVYDAKHSEWR